MSNYRDVLLDFVRRTRINLQLTEQWRLEHSEATFNEVTHLINSLLGFIVLPKEMILDEMRQIEVTSTGIPKWNVEFRLRQGEGRLPRDLRPLLKGLRNSVAHASFEFMSDGSEISGVTFEHREREGERVLWTVAFHLDQLRSFLSHLTDEVEDACKRRTMRRLPAD